ncbi:replication-associated recombination protein A [Kocuria sp. p3-SID1433]|uniref:replication-associated recombination protein A n=1 Tax=unclassified Kocuria TaxID=2649579 RepID=UPI0021A69277|nr:MULTISPECIES: replication-associated recombination protein A [unclassified Kocuria]MCT1600764.1 replication-associated recombination protein A [Kocuria sp. p3-SID1428]MCT2178999.1 replication-associated recombination protein A [Kocuria sp. p3-SID1433]
MTSQSDTSLFDLDPEPETDPDPETAAAPSQGRPGARTGAGRRRSPSPLAVRMRPRTLDEVVGQKHLLRPGSPLRVLAGEDTGPAGPSSIMLWGPPGTGKTTIAHVIARGPHRKFVELSAITAGVKDVRRVMDQALTDRDLHGRTTVLFLDEIHRFTKAQQDALLPGVERGWVVLVAATTENPSFSVISPLLSRSLLLTLQPLEQRDIGELIDRAVTDPRGLDGAVALQPRAREHLLELCGGDARKALTGLEAAAAVALSEAAAREAEAPAAAEGGTDAESSEDAGASTADSQHDAEDAGPSNAGAVPEITVEHTTEAMDRAALRYDRDGDQHYDVISAFIKSIRGSDVDASLHYLARMIEAGEDPRFIARRLIISAAEDIGTADPTALQTAVAAAQAVQLIGMPEGRIPLAEATVLLATAPKSNAAYTAIDQAIADVRAGKAGPVPPHLRDAHYPGAQSLGHGRGYRYAHDAPNAVAFQQYPPDELVGKDYYLPTGYGHDRELQQRTRKLRGIIRDGP